MHLQLALICDHAGTSPEGKLDIHGAFNDLYAPGFPAKQDQMVLVVAIEWDRADEGRHKFRVDLMDPMGKPALTVDGHTDVDRRPPDRPPARTRIILPLENVIFPVPGRYSFDLRVKGKRFQGPSLYLVETESAEETGSPADGARRSGAGPGAGGAGAGGASAGAAGGAGADDAQPEPGAE